MTLYDLRKYNIPQRPSQFRDLRRYHHSVEQRGWWTVDGAYRDGNVHQHVGSIVAGHDGRANGSTNDVASRWHLNINLDEQSECVMNNMGRRYVQYNRYDVTSTTA